MSSERPRSPRPGRLFLMGGEGGVVANMAGGGFVGQRVGVSGSEAAKHIPPRRWPDGVEFLSR